MTNTEIVFRYLQRNGPCLRAAIAAGCNLGSSQTSNALENLASMGMIAVEGRRWSVIPGKRWAGVAERSRERKVRRKRDVDAPRTTQSMSRDGIDFKPLYDAMGMP